MKRKNKKGGRKAPPKAPVVAIIPRPPSQEKSWELNQRETELIKQVMCPGATDLELEFNLIRARRYRLDPFRQQIHFVPRKSDGKKNWVAIVGIDGFRHIAARDHKDYGSFSEPEFGPMKTVEWEYWDKDNRRFAKGKSFQAPEWCRLSGKRKGDPEPTTVTVWWDEIYGEVGSSPTVRKMPRLMLAKCTEAQVTRRMYPATDGLYLAEEFAGRRPDYTREGREIVWPGEYQAAEVHGDLIEYGAYPKNGPKADLAAQQLAKVEAADKEFKDKLASQGPPASTQGPAEGQDRTPQPSAQPKEAPPANSKPKAERSKAEGRGIATPSQGDGLKPPQARIPHKITAIRLTKTGAGLEVELDTGHKLYSFDNFKVDEDGGRFHDLLRTVTKEGKFQPLAVGKMAIFLSQMTSTKPKEGKPSRDFTQIVGLVQLGDREWEDGVPVLRREQFPKTPEPREPGQDEESDWR